LAVAWDFIYIASFSTLIVSFAIKNWNKPVIHVFS